MTDRRWDAAWTDPRGLAPERPPGEPSFGLLAAVHLGVFCGLSALGSLVTVVTGRAEIATAFVLAAVVAAAGVGVLLQRTPLTDWISDLLLAASATYLLGAVAFLAHEQGATDAEALLVGCGVAGPYALAWYVVHRRLWLQVATVAAAALAIGAALATRPEVPDPVLGAYLLVLGGFLTLLAMSGLARPVRSAYVLAAMLATAGAQVLVAADAVGGTAVAAVVLAAVGYGVYRSGNRSLLPVTLVAGVLLVPQILSSAIGGADATAVSLTGTAAAVAWLAVDLQRRSPRPVQVGGVLASCLGLLLVGQLVGAFGRDTLAGDLVNAVALVAFFGAAAAARRRPATVISGFLVVTVVPGALAQDTAFGGLVALVALGGCVAAAIAIDKRAPRPATAPFQTDQALTGSGREWTLQAPYAEAFDTVVAELSSAGVPLQLVDRAAGRVVAGDPAVPWLAVALWSDDPLRTRVRAVGPPWNVDRLQAQLENRLAAPH